MATIEKYLGKLRALRQQHAWDSVTRPADISDKGYAYVVGFQSGLDKAEKLLNEVLDAEKKLE